MLNAIYIFRLIREGINFNIYEYYYILLTIFSVELKDLYANYVEHNKAVTL